MSGRHGGFASWFDPRDRRLRAPGTASTLALWYLRSNFELFHAGDSGANVDTERPSGFEIEWNNIYKSSRWMTLDADFALSQAANPISADGSYMGHTVHAGEPIGVRGSLTVTC